MHLVSCQFFDSDKVTRIVKTIPSADRNEVGPNVKFSCEVSYAFSVPKYLVLGQLEALTKTEKLKIYFFY